MYGVLYHRSLFETGGTHRFSVKKKKEERNENQLVMIFLESNMDPWIASS